MKKIHIHTAFDNNSIEYYKYMVNATLERALNPELIEFYGYFIKSNFDKDLEEYCKNKKINLIQTDVDLNGTDGHVKCFNIIFKNFIKGEINIVSDSDTAICMKNFDNWIRKNLDLYDIIGTRYEDIGGPCVESNYPEKGTLYQTYKNKPNAIWAVFSPRIDFSNLKFKCFNTKDTCLKVDSEDMSEMSGLPIGYYWWRDTGWELAEFIHVNKLKYYSFYKSNALESKSPQGTHSKILNRKFAEGLSFSDACYAEEYHTHEGDIFVIHQRGSRKRKFRIDEVSKRFYCSYEKYIKS